MQITTKMIIDIGESQGTTEYKLLENQSKRNLFACQRVCAGFML